MKQRDEGTLRYQGAFEATIEALVSGRQEGAL